MTFTFFSNFLNHHQLPLCLAWYEALGDAFTFVATQSFTGGEVAASYADMNKAHPFCLAAYESAQAAARAQQLANESDIVLYGAAPPALFHTRIVADKPTFRYSERIFKPYYTKNMAYTYACAVWECLRYARRKNTWLLAAGAYAAHDYACVGGFRGRALRWGYFPSVESAATTVSAKGEALDIRGRYANEIEESEQGIDKGKAQEQPQSLRLLWAGRMIAYKHAERLLPLLHALRAEGISFIVTFAGDGELRAQNEVRYAPFGASVRFVGTVSVAQTRALMHESDLFLCTSDESEGWGAVLSEAMADGCAVLASDACGASPYLVKKGENGLLFVEGSEQDFVQKGLALARSRALRKQLGDSAAYTMRNTWNAQVAATRFLQASTALLAGNPLPQWSDGPCSKDACKAWKQRRKT